MDLSPEILAGLARLDEMHAACSMDAKHRYTVRGGADYAGTFDFLAWHPATARLLVLDWKCGKSVYPEHHAQSAAYRACLRQVGLESAGLIVQVPLDGPVVAYDSTDGPETFMAYLGLHKALHPRQRSIPSVTTILAGAHREGLVRWMVKVQQEADIAVAWDMLVTQAEMIPRDFPAFAARFREWAGEAKEHQRLSREAADHGKLVHALIEAALREQLGLEAQRPTEITDEALFAFERWRTWWAGAGLVPLAVERRVWYRSSRTAPKPIQGVPLGIGGGTPPSPATAPEEAAPGPSVPAAPRGGIE